MEKKRGGGGGGGGGKRVRSKWKWLIETIKKKEVNEFDFDIFQKLSTDKMILKWESFRLTIKKNNFLKKKIFDDFFENKTMNIVF